jgi:hypothetical protein
MQLGIRSAVKTFPGAQARSAAGRGLRLFAHRQDRAELLLRVRRDNIFGLIPPGLKEDVGVFREGENARPDEAVKSADSRVRGA